MTGSIVQRTIHTRGYELDMDGLVPPRTFLCYMEHLRWESLGEGDAQLAALISGGHQLVVVAQQLHLERDVGLGVALDGTLDLGHVGNTSMELVHGFHAPGLGRVARGTVTVVLLAGGRPTPVPDSVRQSAAGRARQALAPSLEGEAPAGAWSMPLTVRAGELDLLRHVNHANHLGYFEDARVAAARQGAHGDGARAGRLRRLALDYRHEALLGDALEVLSWRLDDGALGFELRRSDGRLLSRARVEAG